MKRKGIIMAVVMLALLTAIPLFSAMANNSVIVTVDGHRVHFPDQDAVIIDGRTLVPVRGVFERMGFNVEWDYYQRVARINNSYFNITIPYNSYHFWVNGYAIIPDVPQRIINNRLMLPLRAISEAVGGTAYWHGSQRIAAITSPLHTINDFLFAGRPTAYTTFNTVFFRVDGDRVVTEHHRVYGNANSAFTRWAELNNIHNVELLDHSMIKSSNLATLPTGQMISGTNRVISLTLSAEFHYHVNGENGSLIIDSLVRTFNRMWRPVEGSVRVNLIVSGVEIHTCLTTFRHYNPNSYPCYYNNTINDFLLAGRATAYSTFNVEFFRVYGNRLIAENHRVYGSANSAFAQWAGLNSINNVKLTSYSLIMSSDLATLPTGQMISGTNRVIYLNLSPEFQYHVNGESGLLLMDSLARTFSGMWRPVMGRIRVYLILNGETIHTCEWNSARSTAVANPSSHAQHTENSVSYSYQQADESLAYVSYPYPYEYMGSYQAAHEYLPSYANAYMHGYDYAISNQPHDYEHSSPASHMYTYDYTFSSQPYADYFYPVSNPHIYDYTINSFLFTGRPTAYTAFYVEFFRAEGGGIVSEHHRIYGNANSAFAQWAWLNNIHNVELLNYFMLRSSDVATLPTGQMISGTNRVIDLTLSPEFYYYVNGENGSLFVDSLAKTFSRMWRPVEGSIRVNLIVSGVNIHSCFTTFRHYE